MAKLVSKVYGDALFEAALEDNRLSGLSDEVTAVKEIIAANDDLSKLMDHPQIDKE
ncbi:F0F1 ATP synthase subunit delta, partial [Extibacter muris]